MERKRSFLTRWVALWLMAMLVPLMGLAEGQTANEDIILQEEMNDQLFEGDAELEEYVDDVYEPEVGSFNWYLEPVLPTDMHAYVDIYPEESPVYAQLDANAVNGQSWLYSFTLEETGGYDFYPAVLTVVYFSGGEEVEVVSRESYDAEQLALWWGNNCIPAGSAVTYTGSLAVQDICAAAISIIGNDAQGMEMEFHGVVSFMNALQQ